LSVRFTISRGETNSWEWKFKNSWNSRQWGEGEPEVFSCFTYWSA
jgi:hypothetical protein